MKTHKINSLNSKLFIFTVNTFTLFLYLLFAFKTQLYTRVEGFMSSSIYLLILPTYTRVVSLVVSIITFLVLLIINYSRKNSW